MPTSQSIANTKKMSIGGKDNPKKKEPTTIKVAGYTKTVNGKQVKVAGYTYTKG